MMNALMNLLANVPSSLPEELFETLVSAPAVRIERIVSHGHASPPGFWYDQPQAEWVLVLRGSARLRLADPEETIELHTGNALNIAPHRRHRVEWTTSEEPTVWLAVHYGESVA
ncbi:cupin domain-containing protein [Planctellipticum variicoloris]|jgi:cupin 2 domain-containing protein|uniref:cupin domain-containing protein n=1 Tax=Planctellipticum variicoloris TaxID=3064265 RepID=UPI003013D545|nr:cupin domain-containing protein [Planctomycetaceae bacterium SH412]